MTRRIKEVLNLCLHLFLFCALVISRSQDVYAGDAASKTDVIANQAADDAPELIRKLLEAFDISDCNIDDPKVDSAKTAVHKNLDKILPAGDWSQVGGSLEKTVDAVTSMSKAVNKVNEIGRRKKAERTPGQNLGRCGANMLGPAIIGSLVYFAAENANASEETANAAGGISSEMTSWLADPSVRVALGYSLFQGRALLTSSCHSIANKGLVRLAGLVPKAPPPAAVGPASFFVGTAIISGLMAYHIQNRTLGRLATPRHIPGDLTRSSLTLPDGTIVMSGHNSAVACHNIGETKAGTPRILTEAEVNFRNIILNISR